MPSSQTPDSRRSLLQIYFQPTEKDKANQALMAQAEIAARALWWQMIDVLCESFDFASWQEMRETRLAVQFGDDSSDIFELPSGLSYRDMTIAKNLLNALWSRESNQGTVDRVNRVIGGLDKISAILTSRKLDGLKVKQIEGLGDAIHQTAEAWVSLATSVIKMKREQKKIDR